MSIILGTALAVFSLAIILYPFFKSRLGDRGAARSASDVPNALGDVGDASAPPELAPIYDAINTLQLEYQLGKLPDNLYQEQLRSYRIQAATVLRQSAEAKAATPGWLLEQEVLVARAALRGISGRPRSCPNCRSLAAPDLAVCPECGSNLR